MRKLHYISTKTIKKTKRVTEYVDAELYEIRYKQLNKKTGRERIVKFDARKKLRVEVVFKIKSGAVTRKIVSESYGLPAKKRKRPVSQKIIVNQIARKHALKLKRGHLIVDTSEPLHNMYSWTYYYQDKTKAEKAALRKKRREEKAKLKRKGSIRENRASEKT